jgi:peroxiredoxin
VSNSLRAGAALLLAVLAIWAVRNAALHQPSRFGATPGATPRATPTAASAVTVNGAAPAPPEVPYAMVKIPERLPDFTLANRDGKPTSIADWRGKSLILNFWATWCAPCRREIPILESLDLQWKPRNVAVIGIAVDHRDEVLAFAEALHITYPLLIGEQDALDAAAAVGVDSPVFPFTVFTDRRGEVVAVFVGELHRPQADLILSEVKDIDEDRIALPAARHAIAAGLDTLNAQAAG